MDQSIINNIAQPTNSVQQGFQERTAQTQAEDTQKDNDMLKVFEFAGDGQTDAARYLAQSKGLQVPNEIYANADFAKGLALSGKIYPTDPVAAHKFVMAWTQNPNGDLMSRINTGIATSGVPVDPKDRELQRTIALEVWKNQAPPTPYQQKQLEIDEKKLKTPEDNRFQAVSGAYKSAIQGGMGSHVLDTAEKAAQKAGAMWDQAHPGVSPGLVGSPAPAAAAPPPVSTGDPVQDSLNAIAAQQAQTGVSPGQRPDLVPQQAPPPAAAPAPTPPPAAQPRASGYAPSGGQNLPVMHSAAEAARLAPGTSFMTPDGRVKVRP